MYPPDPNQSTRKPVSLFDCLTSNRYDRRNGGFTTVDRYIQLNDRALQKNDPLTIHEVKQFSKHSKVDSPLTNLENVPKYVPFHYFVTMNMKNKYDPTVQPGTRNRSLGLIDLVWERELKLRDSKRNNIYRARNVNRNNLLQRCALCNEETDGSRAIKLLPCSNAVHADCLNIFMQRSEMISCESLRCPCVTVSQPVFQCDPLPAETFVRLGYIMQSCGTERKEYYRRPDPQRSCRTFSKNSYPGVAPPLVAMQYA